MIDQLGQSDYFRWSIVKSQPIPTTTIEWNHKKVNVYGDNMTSLKPQKENFFLPSSRKSERYICLKDFGTRWQEILHMPSITVNKFNRKQEKPQGH